MTFLGWMHRKLMHNSTEPMKNPKIGNPCTCFPVQTFDEENYLNYNVEPTKTLSRTNINGKKSSNRFESIKVQGLFQEESFEPFEFLAIGTFGMELLNTDSPTPTLLLPSENLKDQETGITENDLKLINYELEKFLEVEEEIANDTSERNSQASIITLGNKPTAGADTEVHTNFMVCPLQNYLFATSSIEVAEMDKEVKKEKSFLEKLFKGNNMAQDGPKMKSEGPEQPRKRNVAHYIKRVMKKLHSSSSTSTASSKDEPIVSIPMKKKLNKALKMLHRKVHPQEMIEKQSFKIQKNEKKDNAHVDSCKIGADENEIVGQAASKRSEKNTRKLPSNSIWKGASTVNRGHWIKTDSDYLVLEL